MSKELLPSKKSPAESMKYFRVRYLSLTTFRFDFSFIKRELAVCNISFKPNMLCSVRLSRALFPEAKGHGLEAIIKRFNIPVTARHRAYDDAEAVWSFLKIAHAQHGQEAFDDAVTRQLKHRSLPPNVNPSAFASIPNNPGVYTFSDQMGMPIYIGKSITLRKRIMSHSPVTPVSIKK